MKKCPEEYPVSLYLNEHELVTIQLSRVDWEDWVVGYLYTEGIIDSPNDLRRILIDDLDFRGKIWVELTPEIDMDALLKRRKYLTAGCGKGVTFRSIFEVKKLQKVESTRQTSLAYLAQKTREFTKLTPMYHETGGMHAACLIDLHGQLIVREDIGRHNAVDKVIGFACRNGLKGNDLILLTTGRISYEMLSKAAKFGIGIVGSRTAATNQAVELAEHLQVEVIGYIRGQMASVYTSCNRVTQNQSKIVGIYT